MAIRVPPGRAGRLWLLRRLDVAGRGADVLDQKRRTLLREQQRLADRLVETAAAWEQKARVAAEWNARAWTLAGPRRLRLAGTQLGRPAELSLERRNALGVVFPTTATVRLGQAPDFVALGGGASITLSARAHADALAAAAAYAAAHAAHSAIGAELAATTRRLRAIERRWIPAHQAALHELELRLDQSELEDTIRVRWAAARRSRNPGGPM